MLDFRAMTSVAPLMQIQWLESAAGSTRLYVSSSHFYRIEAPQQINGEGSSDGWDDLVFRSPRYPGERNIPHDPARIPKPTNAYFNDTLTSQRSKSFDKNLYQWPPRIIGIPPQVQLTTPQAHGHSYGILN